jgi:phosphatidylserine/phosphatidylglycerophosphate/cardiolipin synthase-like enzyme
VPSCVLLEAAAWYDSFCKDVKHADEVELASYMYDNTAVQELFLKRLRGRTAFALNVYVDAEQFSAGVPRLQKTRLKELRSAGAQVYICKGWGRQGAYHCKAAVVDRRFGYSGGANFTDKSMVNEEICFKMAGPVVRQLLERLAQHRQRFKLWNGL